jgi:hypothetical protein
MPHKRRRKYSMLSPLDRADWVVLLAIAELLRELADQLVKIARRHS